MQFLAGLAAAGLIAGAAAAPQVVDVKATSLATTTVTKEKTQKVTSTTTSYSTTTKVQTVTEKDITVITQTETATGKVPIQTVTVTAAPVTVTAPASTSTIYVTVTAGSTSVSKSSSTGVITSSSAITNGTSTTATSTLAPSNTQVDRQYTNTVISAVKAAQATALTSSPTSNVEGLAFDRFITIWLENTDFALANGDPNLAALAAQGISLQNLYGVTHPSEPNYMASHGGDYFGLDGDGLTFVDKSVSTVWDLLDTKSISYGEYQEDMPYSGFEGYSYLNQTTGANDYVRKHDPAVLYDSIANDATRLSTIKNLTQFYADLERDALPQWMFITPNMINDGHDSSVTIAGAWSKNFLQPLLNDTRFNGPKTLILLTFDENHTYTNANNVYGVLLGNAVPKSLVGTNDTNVYTHYSQISSVSANWDLPTLGRWDVGANVYDFVGQQTGDKIAPWTTANGTFPAFNNFHFNASYPGPFNSQNNASGKYPVPNTSAVRNGRAVLPAVQSAFVGKQSSYYPGNVGPMIYGGEVGAAPAQWY